MTHYSQFALPRVDEHALRSLAARSGWLIETTDSMHAGFGPAERDAEFLITEPDLATRFLADVSFLAHPTAPTGSGVIAFLAAPFNTKSACHAWLPRHIVTVAAHGIWLTTVDANSDAALQLLDTHDPSSDASTYDVTEISYVPSPDEYAHAVASAVATMRQGHLSKVVLARRVTGKVHTSIDPSVVVARLHDLEPACSLYALPDPSGGRFVGASPELLVSSVDGAVSAHPLAGTVALREESDTRDYGDWLLGSGKNQFEHRVVVDEIVQQLQKRCVDVRADDTPSIVTLRSVAHLGTWIFAKSANDDPVNALELLALLHPTPAVGGRPTDEAVALIATLEGEDRGLYAGAAGWFDAAGNGDFWLAIRGLVVSGNTFSAWAGAGIVADSDPIAEREETRDKLTTILAGLGN